MSLHPVLPTPHPRFTRTAALLFSLATLLAGAQAKPTPQEPLYDPTVPTKEAPAKAAPAPVKKLPQISRGTRPAFLWAVKSPTNVLFLFGTIHVGKASFYPFPASVEAAIAASDKLVVEADITSEDGLENIGAILSYPKGQTLVQHVPAALIERVKPQLTRYGIPQDVAMSMKPFVLGGLLSISEYARLGYDMTQGVDGTLIKRFRRDMKPVLELESQRGQLELMNNMPPDLQIAFLDNALTTLEANLGSEQVTGMVNAWQSGDAQLLETVVAEANKHTKENARLEDVLLDGRHPAMMKKIEGYLASPDIHFVAVGSLHLVRPTGLLALLKKKGYEVTQL